MEFIEYEYDDFVNKNNNQLKKIEYDFSVNDLINSSKDKEKAKQDMCRVLESLKSVPNYKPSFAFVKVLFIIYSRGERGASESEIKIKFVRKFYNQQIIYKMLLILVKTGLIKFKSTRTRGRQLNSFVHRDFWT